MLAEATFIPELENRRVRKECYDNVCSGGACLYSNCKDERKKLHCPGGACHFIDSVNLSCVGGACTFERCRNAVCEGGSCTYIEPREVLKGGYCPGENCNIEGVSHPQLEYHITI